MLLASDLDDGRSVYLNGKKLTLPSKEPVFIKTLSYVNAYYRLQQTHPETHMYAEDGQQYDIVFKTPHTVQGLTAKRRVYQDIAVQSYGMLGRTPDFIDSGIPAFAAHTKFLGSNEYANFSSNADAYCARIKQSDVFVSHALQSPQIDRSKELHEVAKGATGVKASKVTSEGIYVNGAKMVNTLAPLSNELLIFNTPTLAPGMRIMHWHFGYQ